MNDTALQPLRGSSSTKTNAGYFRLTKTLTAALIAFFVVPGGVADAGTRHAPAAAILKQRPLPPTDITLFSPVAYPDAPPLVPAQGEELDVFEASMAIDDYFRHEPQRRERALDIFESQEAIDKIPSPTLRAALTGLLGTAGQPAIKFILNAKTPEGLPKVRVVGFGIPDEWIGDPAVARVIVEDQLTVIFNPRHQADNPFLFTHVLAHEVLHQNADVTHSNLEETVLYALHTSIHLEQLAKHADLATIGTELARRTNTNALARLNSGTGAKLGLFASNGNQQVLPGSPITDTRWFDQFDELPDLTATPGNRLLRQILGRLAEHGAKVAANPDFDMDTLSFIDRNSKNLSSKELIAAAKALNLQFP